ncbi:MAG: cytochrome P450 [Bacteroidia bacterium]
MYHLPPHPPKKHWLLGNLPYIAQDKLGYFQRQTLEIGDIFELKNPFRRAFITTNLDYIKHLLQDNHKNYTKSFAYDKIRNLLGNGLLTSEGDFWLRQRRLAQPAFYKEKINAMAEVIVRLTQGILEDWEQQLTKNTEIDISKTTNQFALDVVSNVLFISNVQAEVELVSKTVSDGIRFVNERIDKSWLPPLWVPTPRNLRERKTIKTLNNIILQIIENRRKSDQVHTDLLSMLMEAKDEDTGESMTNQQLRDEVMTLFVAGHETTAVALTWTLYLLATHQEKAEKMHAEIDEVLAGRVPQPEDLRKMPYLRQVIEESMRLYPPAWVVGRKSVQADKLGEYDVPPNTNVIMPIYVVHRNPSIWENAEAFEPERFAAGNLKEKHRFAYFPFGGGPRLCIGNAFAMMEMQIALAMIGQRFRFQYTASKPLDAEILITMRPKQALKLKVTKR